jgi:PKD repeat protein
MPRFVTLAAATVLAATASAQFTLVTPSGYAAAEGAAGNTFPWSRGTASTRIQFVVDSSHFTSQGANFPILISQLRYRADAATVTTTWAGGSWPQVRIDMATSAVDYLAVTSTFANNLGTNLATVHNGPVTVAGGTGNGTGIPGPWYITIPLSTPFLYDPTAGGDLVVDIHQDGTGWTGTSRAADHVSIATGPAPVLGSRIYNTSATALTAPTGTVALNYGAVTEFTYVPAAGLYPNFTATPESGPVNTNVAFTNTTYTSDPGGVLAWQWDFENDGIVDSALQNPSHVYPAEGLYSVRLVATDALHGTVTLVRNNLIAIDAVDASFTANVTGGTTVQFTDTSTGSPTGWQWDFQNDGIVDSTAPNPVFAYPSAGAFNCKLTVTDAFSTDTTIVNLGVGIIPQPVFASTFSSAAATRGYWFQAPTRFSITSLQVPDETNNGLQNVALYRLAAAPPVFSASATGGLEFYSTGQPSNAPIPCVVSFDTGEFVGILGACGTTTMLNSYGNPAGPFASSVLGVPCTLTRMLTQFNLVTSGGTAAYSQEPGGQISRVNAGVSAAVGLQYGTGTPSPYAPAPTLKTTALPILGQTAVLSFTSNDTSVIGIVAAGFGRASVPTPLGTLLLASIDFTDVISGAAPLAAGTHTYSFAVPNNAALQGFGPLNWQAAGLVIPTGEFALSNATEWWLAQ